MISVNLPQRVEALQGSCVFIPCTFDIDQQLNIYLTNNAKRKWLTSSTLVFDSSSPNTGLLKGEIFGTATQKNCTTRFDNVSQSHNGSYYFRLESSSALQYSYLYSQVQIAVLGSPPKPTLRVFKDQQELMKMMESHFLLHCNTPATAADHNTRVRMLLVQYAPRNTSVTINPVGLVLEGRSVTLSCSSNANPAVNYTWYRDTNGLLNPVQTGPNLTINDTDSTHRGRYYCTAENKRGTQNISVLLDVQFAPKISSSCSRNSAIVCVCEARGNPCPTLEWRLSGQALANSTETSISVETLGSTGVKSVLTTHRSLTDVLQCFSANIYGSSSQFQPIPPPQEPSVLCSYKINLPNRVEALKGSCVFIPCTFDIGQNLKNDLTDSAKRKWFKGKTLQFDSSSPNNGPLKGEIFGTATQKNCTTCFDNISQSHKGSYYFRLEGSDTLQYSYKEPKHSQVQIVVLESPPKPTLRVFKDQQELMKMMEVIEGSSVNLRCSTKIFCPSRPPSLRWSSSLNENVTEKQYQNQTELISDLNLTVSHRHHRVTFTCTATHQLQQPITTQESWMLLVQYAPRNTSVTINPAGLVLEGRSVTLSCSSNANPAVNYTWYRDTNGLLNPVQTGPNLTINDTDSTHSGQYYCTAENKRGTQNISLLLDVQFAPKISSSCSRNSAMACVCEAHGNPCPTLEWRLSGHVLYNSTETSISEETLGSTGVKGVLTTHRSLKDTDILQCFSANIYGSASQQFQAVPPPKETSEKHKTAALSD
ncbi:hypothetical protein cypCar_00030264 [Cyprinus carpio]|nr:hypothetical protein cypCar_00030264 [Cyprinus carpio]